MASVEIAVVFPLTVDCSVVIELASAVSAVALVDASVEIAAALVVRPLSVAVTRDASVVMLDALAESPFALAVCSVVIAELSVLKLFVTVDESAVTDVLMALSAVTRDVRSS